MGIGKFFKRKFQGTEVKEWGKGEKKKEEEKALCCDDPVTTVTR